MSIAFGAEATAHGRDEPTQGELEAFHSGEWGAGSLAERISNRVLEWGVIVVPEILPNPGAESMKDSLVDRKVVGRQTMDRPPPSSSTSTTPMGD